MMVVRGLLPPRNAGSACSGPVVSRPLMATAAKLDVRDERQHLLGSVGSCCFDVATSDHDDARRSFAERALHAFAGDDDRILSLGRLSCGLRRRGTRHCQPRHACSHPIPRFRNLD